MHLTMNGELLSQSKSLEMINSFPLCVDFALIAACCSSSLTFKIFPPLSLSPIPSHNPLLLPLSSLLLQFPPVPSSTRPATHPSRCRWWTPLCRPPSAWLWIGSNTTCTGPTLGTNPSLWPRWMAPRDVSSLILTSVNPELLRWIPIKGEPGGVCVSIYLSMHNITDIIMYDLSTISELHNSCSVKKKESSQCTKN